MKRVQRILSQFILISCMVVTTTQLIAQQSWEKDDRVLAEWANKAWYKGKIESDCDEGYQILYDDGDTKCCAVYEIITDEIPAATAVEVGTLVLAQWANAYYPAKVTGINGSAYSVVYFDSYKNTLELGQLRILSGEAAKRNDFTVDSSTGSESGKASSEAAMVLNQEMDIWRGSSSWATIETDGDIWIGSSHVGSIESDGDVWISGSNVGEIEEDGDIWFGGSNAGEIESDGDLWRGGSRIAEIESDGDIYLESSWWGEADPFIGEPQEMRVVAAVLAFFAVEFGFFEE